MNNKKYIYIYKKTPTFQILVDNREICKQTQQVALFTQQRERNKRAQTIHRHN